MDSLLLSTHPKWCEMIGNLKKQWDIRKTCPNVKLPFKVYLYMTAGFASYPVTINGNPYICHNNGGQTVIGEFVCDRIEKFYIPYPAFFDRITNDLLKIIDEACLTPLQIHHYIKTNAGYAWHISEVKMYEQQKELDEFFYACKHPEGTDCSKCIDRRENTCRSIKRPPQSWCYVMGVE